AISTVMNQPSSGSAASAAFTAIRASIPQNFKPAALSSFVPLSANSRSSVLAASHKRSAPPPIKLSDPPRVTHADFEPYLHQIQGEWARWEKNLNIGSGGAASLRQSEIVPAGSTAPIKFTTRQRSREPPQLSNVPSVFFDQSFSLANPTTFDIVTERIPAKKNGTTSFSKDSLLRLDPISIPDLATDQILHEKLSHYLNIVELNLVKEIGLRSSSFFSALGNLQSLHSQTASCMAQVDALSSELDQLRSNVAQKGLDMVQCGTRRRNIMKIERALLRVGEICQSVRDVGELVRGGDWNSALGLIEYLEKLWNSHGEDFSEPQHLPSDLPPSSLSLKLRALKSLPNQLSNFRTVISKTLEQELVSILIHDLKVNVQGLTITGGKIVEKSEPSSPSHFIRNLIKERLQERVRETFVGLIRASHIEKALALWKEGVLGEVRELVQNHLSEVSEADIGRKEKEIHSDKAFNSLHRLTIFYNDGSGQDFSSSHTKDYKSLSHSEFLKFAQATYICLLECIEAVNIQSQALLEIAGEIKSSISKKDSFPLPLTGVQTNNSITTPLVIETQEMTSNYDTAKDDIMTLNLDIEGLTLKLCEIVQAAAELANVRFAKVVGTRTEIHASLKLFEFFEIFDVSWHFVVRCEVISRRMIVALRGVMAGQAQAFLKSFHQTKINESAKILEHELWAQVEVPPKINEVVSLIISSAVEDPKALKVNSMTSSSPEVEAVANNLTASPTKQLNVEGTLFHSVNAVLETLIVLKEYLQIVVNCPLLTTDVMAKILEFLKAFNSRTCQVVLGAGAMRSAGLKNITAKHLALASQAVSVMISLIPYIRECLRRHLSMKQAVMLVDFDKLKRDFQEHQNEIHAKLVSIMSDRLGVHVQSLKSIDWERHEDDSGEISHNAYVENLLKEVSTLHRVLSRYLSQSNLTFIMTQVLTAIHDELHKEFSLIEVRTVIAKNRLFADAKYFLKKVVELKSYEEIQARATELVEIVQRKPLPKGLEPDSIDTDSSNQPDSDPISPLAERAEQFKAKFRFLAPRKNSQTPLPVLP
ncbi:Vps54-like protein-domain-containing protein, partial [Phakopsora pachyrhizi]